MVIITDLLKPYMEWKKRTRHIRRITLHYRSRYSQITIPIFLPFCSACGDTFDEIFLQENKHDQNRND